ncbi:MAG TPA: ABC transporter ATP-binding protein [Dehalococcoidia bacterium]|nr:ABC transporter ATP-binding protein [Dehalococcoidia bacterium]
MAGISFAVEIGECFGLLGPNGAGKTTTMRLIAGLSPLTSGELIVRGMDVRKEGRRIRAILGVVPQEENLDSDLTVLQNLSVHARYFDIPKAEALRRAEEGLSLFQLTERRHASVDTLSGGMKRRLLIVRALMNEPRVLILDEPTTGLDPQARHLVWEKLRYLQSQGVTLILCTHNMEEAARLCDRLAILHQGRVLAQGTPQHLVEEYAGREVVEVIMEEAEARQALLAHLAGRPGLWVETGEDALYIYSRGEDGRQALAELATGADRVVYRRANLEDVFLRLTGRGLVE